MRILIVRDGKNRSETDKFDCDAIIPTLRFSINVAGAFLSGRKLHDRHSTTKTDLYVVKVPLNTIHTQ